MVKNDKKALPPKMFPCLKTYLKNNYGCKHVTDKHMAISLKVY